MKKSIKNTILTGLAVGLMLQLPHAEAQTQQDLRMQAVIPQPTMAKRYTVP